MAALAKSVASWFSSAAWDVLPSEAAVLAAFCRLAAICDVTCWYLAGSVCCNCCSVLNIRAKGESVELLSCGRVNDAGSTFPLLLAPSVSVLAMID